LNPLISQSRESFLLQTQAELYQDLLLFFYNQCIPLCNYVD